MKNADASGRRGRHHPGGGLFAYLPLLVLLGLNACRTGSEGEAKSSGEPTRSTGETYSSLFAGAMVELSGKMVAITRQVETVADADRVEPDVARVLDTLALRMAYILENLDRLTEADPEGFRDPAVLMERPEVMAAAAPAEEAMRGLREMNPTAAIRLQLHAEEHSEEAARLIDRITLRWEQASGEHLGD